MYTMIHKNINKTIMYMYISNREQDTMTSEQEWEQVLQIKTTGRDDSRSDAEHHPYEPTDYCVLERLANSGYITKQNTLIDYGSGKGRVSIFMANQTRCHSIGINSNTFCPITLDFLNSIYRSRCNLSLHLQVAR